MTEQEEVKKWCPFLKEWCTKEVVERCALTVELTRSVAGTAQKTKVCVFPAMILILSEINQKTQVPQPQRIVLPGIGK